MIQTIKPIVIGFLISMVCTLAAFFTAFYQIPAFRWIIALLTIVQIGAQFIFFFSLGKERKPYWNLQMFIFTVLILLIIVGLSLWIMYNLNYMMMPK